MFEFSVAMVAASVMSEHGPEEAHCPGDTWSQGGKLAVRSIVGRQFTDGSLDERTHLRECREYRLVLGSSLGRVWRSTGAAHVKRRAEAPEPHFIIVLINCPTLTATSSLSPYRIFYSIKMSLKKGMVALCPPLTIARV